MLFSALTNYASFFGRFLFMKRTLTKLITLTAVAMIFNFNAFAGTDCADNDYKTNGWIIHAPSEFNVRLQNVQATIEKGTKDSSIVEDIQGVLSTMNSSIAPELYVKVTTWDALATSEDVMYGDMAIFYDFFNPERVLEVRWFDGKTKHVVFNKNYMFCIVTKSPSAPNTIF